MKKVFCYAIGLVFVFTVISFAKSSGGNNMIPPEPFVEKGKYTILAVSDYFGSNSISAYKIAEELDYYFTNKYQYKDYGWVKGQIRYDCEVSDEDFTSNSTSSDLLFYIGHGYSVPVTTYLSHYGILLMDCDDGSVYFVSPNDWKTFYEYDNYKWVVFMCCDLVNPNADSLSRLDLNCFTDYFDSVHIILGYKSEVDANHLMDVARYFPKSLFAGQETILNAWKECNHNAYLIKKKTKIEWSAFYLEGAREESIVDPLLVISEYDVWYVEEDWDFEPYSLPDLPSLPKEDISLPVQPTDPGILGIQVLEEPLTVSGSLVEGLIELNYVKPSLNVADNLIASSEVNDYQSIESDFYNQYGDELAGIYNITKVEEINKISYFSENEKLIYYIPTGAVSYTRKSNTSLYTNEQFYQENIEDVVLMAENFINTYGGGLPVDATLEHINAIKHINMTTGNEYIESFVLYYARKYNGIEIIGDGITIEVDVNGIKSYNRVWRNLTCDPFYPEIYLIDDQYALQCNSVQLATTIDEPVEIIGSTLVYFNSSFDSNYNSICPVWKYILSNNETIYIDAINAKLID